MISAIKNLLTYLLYFPSVTFSIVSAEIFPYGLIYSLTKMNKVAKKSLFFIALLTISAIWGGFNYNNFNFEVLRSIAAYLNPVILFYTVCRLEERTINKLLNINRKVFYFLLLLGGFQFSGAITLLGLEGIIDLLMHRGAYGVIGSGRGVALLSSEPSRASYEFLFVYMLFRSFNNYSRYFNILMDVLVSLFLLFVIRSATGAIFLIIFIFFQYRKVFLAIVIFLFIYLSITGLTLETNNTSRALELILFSFEAMQVGGFWQLFLTSSGFRGISVYASYLSGFQNYFGHGVGQWELSSLNALNNTGFLPSEITYFSSKGLGFTSVRPTSYIAALMLDIGLIGVSIFIYLIHEVFKIYESNKGLLFCFLFYIFFMGDIGNPVPWLVMAISVAKNSFRESCNT